MRQNYHWSRNVFDCRYLMMDGIARLADAPSQNSMNFGSDNTLVEMW